MNDCPRVGKLFGACNFSPRFDLGAPSDAPAFEGSANAVYLMTEQYRPKTYVRDICERCGKVLER